MCFVITCGTDFGTAVLALGNFPTMLRRDVVRLDPLATVLADTVNTILGLVLQEPSIPCFLEGLIE